MYISRYDTVIGQYLGLHETLGYLTLCGDANKYLLDYGFSEQDS